MTRWLVPVACFILALLFLFSLVAATEIGKYRESFGNAKFEINRINANLSYMEGVTESAVEELRGRVSRLKSEFNITDMEVAEERLEVEKKATEALRNNVSKVKSVNKKVLLAVFGTFGVLAGFWGAFFVYTFLCTIRKR
jgi:hypothetical protein